MVSLLDMKQAARVVQDENGNPVVQVPLAVWEAAWEAVVSEVFSEQPAKAEQILAALKSWENDLELQQIPQSWWDELDRFLKDNRVKIGRLADAN